MSELKFDVNVSRGRPVRTSVPNLVNIISKCGRIKWRVFKITAAAILNIHVVPVSIFVIWAIFVSRSWLCIFLQNFITVSWPAAIELSKILNGVYPPSWIIISQHWTTREVFLLTASLCSNFVSIELRVSKICSLLNRIFFANLV